MVKMVKLVIRNNRTGKVFEVEREIKFDATISIVGGIVPLKEVQQWLAFLGYTLLKVEKVENEKGEAKL